MSVSLQWVYCLKQFSTEERPHLGMLVKSWAEATAARRAMAAVNFILDSLLLTLFVCGERCDDGDG